MILQAEAVTKKYFRNSAGKNYFYAVNETNFTLKEGAVTEIIGRSGSGKTTFLNILAGLLEVSSGKVLLDGIDMYSLSDKKLSALRNKSIGIIPQGHTALDSLTVFENVGLPHILYSNDDKADEYADELLDFVGIKNLRDVYPSELSGGELRRLAVARAMIQKPSIILADEPTGDLDDENTDIVLRLLRKAADDGKSVLLVTHESEAEKYADFVYRMNSGNLEKVR